MKELEIATIKEDLYKYFQNKNVLIPPEFVKVVADATRFTVAVIQQGFEIASTAAAHVKVQPDQPFIEVAEAVVDHQVRFVRQKDRDMVQKSLIEAYTHIAGPRYVFEPARKTRFVRSLQRSGPTKFAALLLSLHLYNLICALIRDDLRTRISNARSFELYMLNVEAICRDVVKEAVKIPAIEIDEAWAKAVVRSVESELLHRPPASTKSPNLSVPTGIRK